MTSTVVHIGTPKTGTTSLQLALEQNRARLAAVGWHIPTSGSLILEAAGPAGVSYGRTICHHGIAWSLQGDRPLPFGIAPIPFADLTGALLSELVNKKNLITSECLYWEIRELENINLLKRAIPKNAKIVIFLRNRWDFIESMYAQAVYDHGFRQNLDEFVNENIAFFDYGAAISQWASVFGSENIIIRRYESSVNSLSALMDILDVDTNGWVFPNSDINSSIPKAILPILKDCQLDRARFLHLADNAKRYSSHFPKVRLLSVDQIDYLSDQYRPGDIFLQTLGVDIGITSKPIEYLQARHFSDVTVDEISVGLGFILSSVM